MHLVHPTADSQHFHAVGANWWWCKPLQWTCQRLWLSFTNMHTTSNNGMSGSGASISMDHQRTYLGQSAQDVDEVGQFSLGHAHTELLIWQQIFKGLLGASGKGG